METCLHGLHLRSDGCDNRVCTVHSCQGVGHTLELSTHCHTECTEILCNFCGHFVYGLFEIVSRCHQSSFTGLNGLENGCHVCRTHFPHYVMIHVNIYAHIHPLLRAF